MSRIVELDRHELQFCRITTAILLWITLILRDYRIMAAAGVLMGISFAAGVKYAPQPLIYRFTLGLLIPGKKEVINYKSIRFAHLSGFLLSLTAIGFWLIHPIAGLIVSGVMTLLHTIAAAGYCSAQKFYECQIEGSSCCRIGKRYRKRRNRV